MLTRYTYDDDDDVPANLSGYTLSEVYTNTLYIIILLFLLFGYTQTKLIQQFSCQTLLLLLLKPFVNKLELHS